MKFRTELSPTSYTFNLSHKNNILSIGSCFAETIGSYLEELKFNILTNPLGTIFNPVAICNIINWGIKPFTLNKDLITQKEGLYTHFLFHSEISATSISKLEVMCKKLHTELHEKLTTIDTMIITLGTAYSYKHSRTNTYVTNCHKVPQKEFSKELIDTQTIEETLRKTLTQLPNLKNTIITVSPVRHIKDTIELNSVSKSILRLACHQLSTTHPNTHYFPSYEIMLDDLRDYRFYKEDMIHPTEQARAYICEYFATTLFSEDTIKTNVSVQQIKSAVNHRPFNPSSEEHQKFIQKTIAIIKQSTLDFSKELEILSEQVNP